MTRLFDKSRSRKDTRYAGVLESFMRLHEVMGETHLKLLRRTLFAATASEREAAGQKTSQILQRTELACRAFLSAYDHLILTCQIDFGDGD